MKKIVSIILSICLLVSLFSSCSGNLTSDEKDNKLNIVTTIFSGYDWIKSILGENSDNINTTLLIDGGADLHSFQPSVDDIIKISTCDMFIYVGGESDEWVEDALKQKKNKNMIVVSLMEILSGKVKVEEKVDGMQVECNENEEYDEHVWLSLNNAKTICEYLCQKMIMLDPDNKDLYVKNTDNYVDKLTSLDREYKSTVEKSTNKTIVLADRFPFRYLTDDYSINYFAAFKGCSAESEANFETIRFLSNKVDELNLSCVLTVEGGNDKIAKTVVSNTKNKNQTILTLDSMQSTTLDDVENGLTYISIMQKNLEVLKEALK